VAVPFEFRGASLPSTEKDEENGMLFGRNLDLLLAVGNVISAQASVPT
jgi:hypothetical protein